MNKASDTSKSIHLSASAGSGKTRALKDRYLALLELLDTRGLNIDQAVAITFTDKAAAEIKERIMRGLPEAMLKRITRGGENLRISTIHSFCMNLLKRYPLEAGLPPDFGVLDARDQAFKIQKAIEDALEESDDDQMLMAPLNEFTADELIVTIDFLISIRSKLKRIEIDAGGPGPLVSIIRKSMAIDEAETELTSLIASPEWRRLFGEIELLMRSQGSFYEACNGPGHASLAAARDAETAYRLTQTLLPLYLTQQCEPRKKCSIPRTKFTEKEFRYSAYEALYARAQEALQRFRSAYLRAHAGQESTSLIRLFLVAEGKYQNAKLREGLLDFDDLEIYTYRLLQRIESAEILYWLDRKILHFLVDEFQDTSDLQWAILNKLTEEIFAGRGADKPVQPTLFVVGDEKQSIYRFREANHQLIEDVKQKIERNLEPQSREILTLETNFRSTPEIIRTVNAVFSSLWPEAYQPSAADRKEHTGSVRLIELQETRKEQNAGTNFIGPDESQLLVREIKALISSGALVYEKSTNAAATGWQERAAGYGDCAILIQSRTKLKEYEAALQAGNVPYRVIGGIGFYEEDEVQAIMNVLFFLWNPDDRLALAAALKSDLFGLTDKDLYDVMQEEGKTIDILARTHPGTGSLLRGWINLAGLVPLPGLIHRIVNETGAYVRFGRKNPQALFNLDKLLDTAREFDRRGYVSLQDFVEWVKNIRNAEQREATADLNLPGFEGSVSVMTVHKAKGLEYPIVFLPGMNQLPRSLSTGPRAIVEDRDGRVRMALKDGENPVYDELWEREHEELVREHQRLLYVAMTRARDHLIMLGTLGNGKGSIKPNTWLSFLHQTSPHPLFSNPVHEMPDITLYADSTRSKPGCGSVNLPPAAASRLVLPGDETSGGGFGRELSDADIKTILQNLSPVKRSETTEWKKATDFIKRDQDGALEGFFIQSENRVISPLIRGNVLHQCLEEFTKTGTCDLDRMMSGHHELFAFPEDIRVKFREDVQAVLSLVLNHPQNSWIFERREDSYSELPFLYARGGSNLVTGVMDRIVVKEGLGRVIDYKAILIENEESLASWTEHYLPQIRIYCEAAKHIFALRKVEGFLLFLDSNKLQPCVEL